MISASERESKKPPAPRFTRSRNLETRDCAERGSRSQGDDPVSYMGRRNCSLHRLRWRKNIFAMCATSSCMSSDAGADDGGAGHRSPHTPNMHFSALAQFRRHGRMAVRVRVARPSFEDVRQKWPSVDHGWADVSRLWQSFRPIRPDSDSFWRKTAENRLGRPGDSVAARKHRLPIDRISAGNPQIRAPEMLPSPWPAEPQALMSSGCMCAELVTCGAIARAPCGVSS